jgi:hypothetical protein
MARIIDCYKSVSSRKVAREDVLPDRRVERVAVQEQNQWDLSIICWRYAVIYLDSSMGCLELVIVACRPSHVEALWDR